MRPLYLLLSSFSLLALVACGTEEEIIPPVLKVTAGSGSLGSTTILTAPSQDDTVTIAGTIDDTSATLVANSSVTGEVPLVINSGDGSWIFAFNPLEGANTVTLTASDDRGNINQMILSMTHDTTAPAVISVTQGVDPAPQLFVTFNEDLLESSLATATFLVDGVPVSAEPYTPLLPGRVTLNLGAALVSGNSHQLACTGIRDLSTPEGNSVAADYTFDFTLE